MAKKTTTTDTVGLRARCAALSSQLQRDGMLRQNDPVQTIMDFVLAERGRAVEVADKLALVLYFGDEAGRDEFTKVIVAAWSAESNIVSRKVL